VHLNQLKISKTWHLLRQAVLFDEGFRTLPVAPQSKTQMAWSCSEAVVECGKKMGTFSLMEMLIRKSSVKWSQIIDLPFGEDIYHPLIFGDGLHLGLPH
jgi:hypothetical protein